MKNSIETLCICVVVVVAVLFCLGIMGAFFWGLWWLVAKGVHHIREATWQEVALILGIFFILTLPELVKGARHGDHPEAGNSREDD